MKLSDAIRLGSTMGPQGFGYLYDTHNESSCALGAALVAMGKMSAHVGVVDVWPWIMQPPRTNCPECKWFRQESTGYVITHLNDHHRWTREAIADWVATIEPPEPVEPILGPATKEDEEVPLVA